MSDLRGGPGHVAVARPIAPGPDAWVPSTGVNGVAFRYEVHGAVTALVLLAELGRDVPGEMSMLGS